MSNNRLLPGHGGVSETGLREALVPGSIGLVETVSSVTPIDFSGTVSNQTGSNGSSFSLGLSSYFSGTQTPFSYTLQSGSLSGSGLTLGSSTGVISGTAVAGTYSGLVVRGTDSSSNTADTNSFSITIVTAVAFGGTVSNQTATQSSSFSLSLSSFFSGALTPFTYSLQSGTLPAGLSLNTSTGAITGAPTTPGTASGLVVRATDTGSNTADTNSFSITVNAAVAAASLMVVMMSG